MSPRHSKVIWNMNIIDWTTFWMQTWWALHSWPFYFFRQNRVNCICNEHKLTLFFLDLVQYKSFQRKSGHISEASHQSLKISLTGSTCFFNFSPLASNLYLFSLFHLSISTSARNSSLLFLPLPPLFAFFALSSLCARGWNAWCNAACLGPSSSFNENVSIWLESCQESLHHGSYEWGWSVRSRREECVSVGLCFRCEGQLSHWAL